ncbi:MAG: helix-turn-helix domain-containing protein [Rhodocyclaceae bacterium]|nr:helix-turn-helix domain-containing protein [Rhodocyclaceae bacterium]MCA3694231.1 helix-turn-helix domain-containing protein [Aquidulcibacter sp.]
MSEQLLSFEETCERLRIGADGLRGLCEQGIIPHLRINSKYIFIASTLDTWLVESALQKASLSTSAKTPKAGGATSLDTERELRNHLARKTERRQPRSPRNAGLKLVQPLLNTR